MALGLLLCAELLFRGVLLVDPSLGQRVADHRAYYAPMADLPNISYEPHPYWVFNATPGQPGVNSWGFNFDETPLERTPGVMRVLTLGGSSTAGPQAWPYHLGEVLRERYGQEVEIINLGTGGWTSAESTVAYVMLGQSFSPDVVVLHHANNDIDPLRRADFRPDYAHYRKPIALERDELGRLRVRLKAAYVIDSNLVRLSSLYVYLRLWVIGDRHTLYTLNTLATIESSDMVENADDNTRIFERNFVTVGTLVRATGGELVLTTIPHTESDQPDWAPWLDRQNQRVLEIAERHGYPSVALHEEPFPVEWFEDPIHVSQDGERAKAEHIAEVVGPLLFP